MPASPSSRRPPTVGAPRSDKPIPLWLPGGADPPPSKAGTRRRTIRPPPSNVGAGGRARQRRRSNAVRLPVRQRPPKAPDAVALTCGPAGGTGARGPARGSGHLGVRAEKANSGRRGQAEGAVAFHWLFWLPYLYGGLFVELQATRLWGMSPNPRARRAQVQGRKAWMFARRQRPAARRGSHYLRTSRSTPLPCALP